MKAKKIIVAILLCIFAAGVVLAVTGVSADAEQAAAHFINPNGKTSMVMKIFTNIGEAYGVIGLTAVLMLIPVTRRRIGAPLAVIITSSWLTNTLVKNIIRRARPAERFLEIGGYSFPSGHAMNNMALYLSIMLLALRICKTRAQKTTIIVICTAMPLIIGFSRVYFNVHYITDILCGWSLGAVIALVGCSVYFNIEEKRKLKS